MNGIYIFSLNISIVEEHKFEISIIMQRGHWAVLKYKSKHRKVDVLSKYGIQGLTFQAKALASSLTLRDNKTTNTNL